MSKTSPAPKRKPDTNETPQMLDGLTLAVTLALLQTTAEKAGRAKARRWKTAPQWAENYRGVRDTWRHLARRAVRETDAVAFANKED